ncbi:MAG: hypothetical protein ACK53K_08295 [Burkholderiales bacterium]
MSMTDTEDQDGVQRCRYCSQAGGCDHVLLVVDTTFRSADGGPHLGAEIRAPS